ncbi:MAG: hypothetical protein IJ928_11675, partial [Prevotella sp.]|nr:hypothetical protein [Prevotella sp.]
PPLSAVPFFSSMITWFSLAGANIRKSCESHKTLLSFFRTGEFANLSVQANLQFACHEYQDL